MPDADNAQSHGLFDRTVRSVSFLCSPKKWSILALVMMGLLSASWGADDLPPRTDHQLGYQPSVVAIVGAKLVTAPGVEINQGTMVIRHGIIVAVGTQIPIPAGAEVIDGQGLVAYAGFIDAACSVRLKPVIPVPDEGRRVNFEEGPLAATPTDNRRGMTPELNIIDQAIVDADFQSVRRKSGISDVHLVNFAPIAGGQTAVISLSGLPKRESVVWTGGMSTFALTPPPEHHDSRNSYPVTLMGATAHLRQSFLDAQHYREHLTRSTKFPTQIAPPHVDPVLAALVDVLEKQNTPLMIAGKRPGRDDLDRALDFDAEFNLGSVIWTGSEPFMALERLKTLKTDLILSLDLGEKPQFPQKAQDKDYLPRVSPLDGLRAVVEPPQRYQDDRIEHWKRRALLAKQLVEADVRFAFSSEGLKQPSDWLPQIRLLIDHGLSESQALAAMTRDASEILGIQDELGTLEVGKRGHVVLLDGSLARQGSQVRHLLVDGLHYEFNKPKGKTDPDAKPPAANLTGKWKLEIQSSKVPTEATLDLAQDGNRITGTLNGEHGEGRIANGKISGSEFQLTIEIGAGDKVIQLDFQGIVVDDSHLSGKVESAFGAPTTWTGTRSLVAPQTPPAEPDATNAATVSPTPGANQSGAIAPAVQLTLDESPEDDPPQAQQLDKGELGAEKPQETTAVPATPAEASSTTHPAQRDASSTAPGKAVDQTSDDRKKLTPTYPTELTADRIRRPEPSGGRLLIRGGTIFTGTGEVLEGTSILIEAGTIKAIGADLMAPEGVQTIDATGRFIVPGLVDTHSHIMIDGGVNEYSQSVVCEVRVKDTISTCDVAEYRALAGGVTTARLLHGSANTIGGQDAVVKLKVGVTAREHLLEAGHQGVKFALGENVKRKDGRFPNTRLGVEAVLQRAFFEALDYRRRWLQYEREIHSKGDQAGLLPPRRDLRLEELVDLIEGRSRIHSHCYRADETLMLLRTAEGLGIRVQSLQHILEGYKIAPEIAKHGASCSTFADWWAYKIEAYDATPFNTSMLQNAGVNTVVKSDDAELMRQLNLEASKSLKYGNMPLQNALQMVTLNAARELGLHQRIGSIEVGKDGDLAIYQGHPFSSFARVEMTIIEGEIRFQRDQQPTVMSASAVQRTTKSPQLVLASPEVRERRLDLLESAQRLYAITGATVHPVDAADLENGIVVIRDGKIEAVGTGIPIPEGAQTIVATGMHLYPGLIDAGTSLGIAEIELEKVTQDAREVGHFQPDLRAGIAVNVESELVLAARAGGITTAFLRPHGGIIGGQCSLIQTAGWTPEEMVRNYDAGMSVSWPDDEQNQQRLTRFIQESRLYHAARSDKESEPLTLKDPRYEAMRPYVSGKRRLFIEAHTRKQIASALLWAEEEKLQIVITGGHDAWKLTAELKARKVPVIVGPIMRAPIEDWDPYDATYANPGRLYEAGIPFCIRSDNASNSRNAPLEAGRAVAFGLPEAEALKSVTLNAARLLGIAKECGSITPGKRADLIITDGSPLQTTTQIKGIFVSGQPFRPESRQTRLYEKYRVRLHQRQ